MTGRCEIGDTKMPDMRSVYSSHVDQIGHDQETGELHVVYKNGRRSIYEGVPAAVAENVMGAASIGSALHSLVKNQYNHRYGS